MIFSNNSINLSMLCFDKELFSGEHSSIDNITSTFYPYIIW